MIYDLYNLKTIIKADKYLKVTIAIALAFILFAPCSAAASTARGVKVPGAGSISLSAPVVVKVHPQDGEIDVTLDTKIMATFNKKMREEDINEFSVTLNDGISDISTTVKYNNDLCKAVISPLENLQAGRVYYVTISRMVRDLNGATMVSDKVWKFTVVKKTDKNPPVIVDVSPTVSAVNVPTGSKIEVVFNKKMFEPGINENTITLKHGREKIIGAIRYYADINKAIFAPINPLKPDSLFEVNISADISDASRNSLSRAYTYTFKTAKTITASDSLAAANEDSPGALIESAPELSVEHKTTANARIKKLMQRVNKAGGTLPDIESAENQVIDDAEKPGYREKKIELVEMFPAPSSDMINTDEKIKVRFNKRMNPGTFNIFNFALQDGEEYIFGKIEYNAKTNTAVFTPAGKLKTGRKYRITISEKIEDIFGERLGRDYSWEFTTITKVVTAKVKDMFTAPDAGGKDVLGPNVITTSPKDNEENVAAAAQITATFNEAVKDFSLNSFTFRVMDGETEVRGKIYYDALQKKAIFTPAQPLGEGRAYTARITGGVMDLAGNYMQRERKWKFIIGKSWNKRSPSIVKITPDKGETDVDISSSICVYFDRKMKASTITPYSFFVTDGVKSVQGRVIYEQSSDKATFAPWSTLAPNKIYNVTAAKTIEDLEGMGLAETMMWQFKTGSGLKGRIAQLANVTSVAAESDANMQVKLQQSMGSADFTDMRSASPAAAEAAAENGGAMNENEPQKTALRNLLPAGDAVAAMSVSDKSAMGNISARRVADTTYKGELYADDSPVEMNNRYKSSDKGAYGKINAARIKDTIDKTDIIDEAMNETLKDQIAKFLSDDYKTANKLAAQIDTLPSVNSPLSDARSNGAGVVDESHLQNNQNFIETPREAAKSFARAEGESQRQAVKNNIAANFDGSNKVYTRPGGIIPQQEINNPKSVYTQMSNPPSKSDSIYSPNPAPTAITARQPRLSNSDEGLVKLEKVERYGETYTPAPAEENEDENKGVSPEPAEDDAVSQTAGNSAAAQPAGNSPIQQPAGESIKSFNPPAAPSPKGMINGVPIEEILAEGNLDAIAQAQPVESGAGAGKENGRAQADTGNKTRASSGFKQTGPGLSDVGMIPRDKKSSFFITAIYPNKNMNDVKVDSSITAVFSQDLDASSVNGASFIVSGGEVKVEGKILYNQRMKKVIFRPAGYLEHGVKYEVKLTPAIKSSTGQALLPLNWSFITR
jgi:hypothetical protein